MRGELYQTILIILGIIVTALFGAFFYRELFPEYKVYQEDYVSLENFRSSYTGEAPPPFKQGIKQIVMERKDKGPSRVERCISCHVALEFEHFSPTKIAYDELGKVIKEKDGTPKKVTNDQFVWKKLEEKVNELKNKEQNDKLLAEGKKSEVHSRLAEAERLDSLKFAKIEDHLQDVTKVLAMHPLIGKETRPFEFHPIEEYGCVSCHGGNESGLTTEKAHGPVFDGQYEEEFMGPEPTFLEKDPNNDPQFSTIFNHKPGHQLLFQTTPIYVGALIEAKCVQCHQTTKATLNALGDEIQTLIKKQQPTNELAEADQPFKQIVKDRKALSAMATDIDLLTQNYQYGEHLFISQACYACHKIAGLTRGGVGPELTEEGYKYPWFIKESIVWPQADMKTSTMPNFRLDHHELEALTTFLLAQKGQRKSTSDTQYKIFIQEWEAGKKMAWEEPASPAQMHNIDYGKEVFATEGCAACHRLKGFESNVGFAVEKDKEATFDTLYNEQEWFTSLFPEEIPGSQIVEVLEKHSEEIDRRIVDGVRKDSILEKISASHPNEIEGFYSNFKYAARAKNHEHETKDHLNKEWKERVHRVLMAYIQAYGLGRLIGPKPNWSGIYRSDEWLMGHFKNPTSHVPRSIMPRFPFDTTKFYALTYMLNSLGIQNRNELRKIWEERGFNPKQAYETLCMQCHGQFLQGNGPVSNWIYPVPKSLRNADFLRNLTKERVYQSIQHGVKGTPMAPWGEIGRGKWFEGNKPILTKIEIRQLVDWIYSSLPGSHIIRDYKEVPKWQYTPEKIIEELKKEGSELKKKDKDLSFLPNGNDYYVAIHPKVYASPADPVTEYFDISSPPVGELEKHRYTIKSDYYTPENLLAGKNIFELNCAVCHGREADGSGMRAGAMIQAKPRMLTNLEWLDTRDDLRLLRSIKYGVPGTAMTAWGDQTNALQRMQLVMYIRTLSQESKLREQLQSALYKTFDASLFVIENMRILKFPEIASTETNLKASQRELVDEFNRKQLNDKEKAINDKI